MESMAWGRLDMAKSKRLRRNNFLVAGRAGMDIYAHPPGTRLEDAAYFQSALGGSAANIAAAIARLGGKASLLTCVSDDAVGRFVRKQLGAYGIDDRFVFTQAGEARNSLAVVETRSEDCQSVIYRNNAADLQLTLEQAGSIDLEPFGALVITGTGLALEPSRSAVTGTLMRARSMELPVIFDIDFRPYSWRDKAHARDVCGHVASLCDFVVGNVEEFDLIADAPGGGLEKARTLAAREGAVCVYKKGGDGSVTFSGGTSFETPVFPVKALKPTGAGDAFLGAIFASLADGLSLEESVRRGSAAAAMVVTKVACAPASPTRQELAAFIEANS
jgi:5-dehydro-2-deoxygluconokinase